MQTINRAISFALLTALSFSLSQVQAQSQKNEKLYASVDASDIKAQIAKMPVKEVTIFKDGHAVIDQAGLMQKNANGDVVLDSLPNPVLGTFFPYSLDKDARLNSVTAGQRKITVARTALTVPELIAGNPGAMVRIDELSGTGVSAKIISYDAQIIGIPQRSAEEQAKAIATGESDALILPIKSQLVELKTESGTSFVPIERIQTVTFKSNHKSMSADQEIRSVLTLKLAGGGSSAARGQANVGMMYVQKGLRWIPSYKVIIDGQGHAKIRLQATIVNDLIDLEDVSANLVVGVPSFAFAGENDPMALGQTLSTVASHAQVDSRLRNSFSNSIMAQSSVAFDQERDGFTQAAPVTGTKNEDLYVFAIKHMSLKKGERTVLPVQEYQVNYKDVYTLDLPVAAPVEIAANNQNGESQEKESLKLTHKLRLQNSASDPFTTAPALVLLESAGKSEVLAQGRMTYAAPGSMSEIDLNAAIDVKIKKTEQEVSRTPDAVTWQDNKYARINMKGVIDLTSYSGKAVQIEVTRKILGKPDKVSQSGTLALLNPLDDWKSPALYHYNWPGWWSQMNGLGQFVFKREIAPKDKAELEYEWHYFWRY